MPKWAEVMEGVVRDRRHALVGYAFLVCGSMSEAEDLAQEAIVKTFARGRTKTDIQTAEAYIKRAIVNEALNRARHREVANAKQATIAEASSEPGPDAHIGEHADVQAALAELSSRERVVAVLRFYEDLSVAQIAVSLKLADGTVKRYLHNAVDRLRDILGEDSVKVEARDLAPVLATGGERS
jgi:RNA polymerase sigma factor (sigma-70 family)